MKYANSVEVFFLYFLSLPPFSAQLTIYLAPKGSFCCHNTLALFYKIIFIPIFKQPQDRQGPAGASKEAKLHDKFGSL